MHNAEATVVARNWTILEDPFFAVKDKILEMPNASVFSNDGTVRLTRRYYKCNHYDMLIHNTQTNSYCYVLFAGSWTPSTYY